MRESCKMKLGIALSVAGYMLDGDKVSRNAYQRSRQVARGTKMEIVEE